jgi:hypothetical protein
MRLLIILVSFGLAGPLQPGAAHAGAASGTDLLVTPNQRAYTRTITVTGSGIKMLEHRWIYGSSTNGFGLEQYKTFQSTNLVTIVWSGGKDIKVTSPSGEKFVHYSELVFGSHHLRLRLPAMGVVGLGGILLLMAGWAVGIMLHELTAKPRRSDKGAM